MTHSFLLGGLRCGGEWEGPVGEGDVSSQGTPTTSRGVHDKCGAPGAAVGEGVWCPSFSKTCPHHRTWPMGWKPGGCSRRSICELEDQHFPSPGLKQRGGS